MLLQRRSNGGFTASREPREPDGETLLAAKIASFGVCKRRVPCYVSISFLFLFEIVWDFQFFWGGRKGFFGVKRRENGYGAAGADAGGARGAYVRCWHFLNCEGWISGPEIVAMDTKTVDCMGL